MKIYSKYLEEYSTLLYSIIDECKFEDIKNLLKAYTKIGFDLRTEIYREGGEFFFFTSENYLEIIDNAIIVTEEELNVLNKFGICGVDIFLQMTSCLEHALFTWEHINKELKPSLIDISKEDLNYIRPFYLKVFDNIDPAYKSLLNEN